MSWIRLPTSTNSSKVTVTNIGRTVTKGSLEGLSLNESFEGNSAQNEEKSFFDNFSDNIYRLQLYGALQEKERCGCK